MRTGFREIQRNFSNSAKNAGFRDFRGFRGIAENRQPYVPHRQTLLRRCVARCADTNITSHSDRADDAGGLVWSIACTRILDDLHIDAVI